MARKKATRPAQPVRHVRWMIRRDMFEVLDIEKQSFDQPWTEEQFIHCLRQRNCIGMVLEEDDRVIGFMIYELHKTRLAILNFAVALSKRRSGVGRSMVDKLIGKLSPARRTKLLIDVRESNLPAQVFLGRVGFRCVGIKDDAYPNEDGYAFEYRLGEPVGYTPTNRISRFTD